MALLPPVPSFSILSLYGGGVSGKESEKEEKNEILFGKEMNLEEENIKKYKYCTFFCRKFSNIPYKRGPII